MSDPNLSFLDMAAAKRARPEDIDDFIDRWHSEPSGNDLPDYLGMTQAEYASWLSHPDTLSRIIQARQRRKPKKAFT